MGIADTIQKIIDKDRKTDDTNTTVDPKVIESLTVTLGNLGSKLSEEIKEQIASSRNLLGLVPNSGTWGPALGKDDELASYMNLIGDNDTETEGTEKIYKLIDKEGLLKTNFYTDPANAAGDDSGEENTKNMSLMLGRCPVLNPPWQFGELDDVRSNRSYPLIGRVYLNHIYSNYPIIAFEPGREKFSLNLLDFIGVNPFGDHKQLNKYIRTGGKVSVLGTIGEGALAVKNVLLAVVDNAISLIPGMDNNRFVKFIPAMPLFVRYTNDLLRELAANMNLLDGTGEGATEIEHGIGTKEYIEALKIKITEVEDKDETGETVKTMKEEIDDPDGKTIQPNEVTEKGKFSKVKDWFANVGSDLMTVAAFSGSSYRGSVPRLNLINFLPASTRKGDFLAQNRTYLPFLCQKAITVSETFNNSTQQHPVADQLNSMASENDASRQSGGLGAVMAVMGTKGDLAERGQQLINEGISRLAGEVTANVSELGMLINGGGRTLLPDMWSGSSFSRDYSIDFTFFSPSGDTVSIFENEYIQLAILLVLSNPLQTGKYLYTSPFVIRVYSKGLFSVDMGMITSLTVTRGQDKNDRTVYGLPRTLKINLSIKDLAPVFMLSLGGGGFWRFRKSNVGLGEYIATLSNISIADRYSLSRKLKMAWGKIKNELVDSTFNLDAMGFNFAQKFAAFKPAAFWSKGATSVDSSKAFDAIRK